MNYIWNILINADKKGINRNRITFKKADIYSPYMEIAFENINEIDFTEDTIIEMNPWYRFHEIFKDLLDINFTESEDLKEVLFDIVIHYLGNIDSHIGLCRKQVIKNLLIKDINNYVYGSYIKENFKVFNGYERDSFLDGLINIYECNTSLMIFKKIVRQIFTNNIIYINKDNPKDIYIYLGQRYTDENNSKIKMIIDIFLPLNMREIIFWDKHFGIIGMEQSMIVEEIVMVN